MIPSGRIFKNTININSTKPISVESYMESDLSYDIYNMLSYIEESAFDVYSTYAKQKHYAMLENDVSILIEGTNDIKRSIKDFFTKLIDKLSKFYHIFVTSAKTYVNSFSKFLKNNEEKIRLLPDKRITFEGYEYTVEYDVPKTDIVDTIIYDYNAQIENIDLLTKNDVDKKNSLFKIDKTQDNIRSKIIGKSVNTNKCSFYDEVDKLFRNDKSDPCTLIIDKSYIMNILNNHNDFVLMIDKTSREFKDIERCLKDLRSMFSKPLNVNRNDKTTTFNKIDNNGIYQKTVKYTEYSRIELYEEYLRYQFKYTKFVSSCIVNVYMQKVKAIKDAMKQYENILKLYISEKK